MRSQTIIAMIFLFAPFVIFVRLLPLLLPLALLVFLCVLGKVYLEKLADKRRRKRWRTFSVDQEYWASRLSQMNMDGAIKLDLTHRWIAFDLVAHETPPCVPAASVRSCRLVEPTCVEVTVRGIRLPSRAYSPHREAMQIAEAINRLRSANLEVVSV